MKCGSHVIEMKDGCCRSEKAALSQGGFVVGRGREQQRHKGHYA
jgi:hypothetical protein